jgi:hypothetical protein
MELETIFIVGQVFFEMLFLVGVCSAVTFVLFFFEILDNIE